MEKRYEKPVAEIIDEIIDRTGYIDSLIAENSGLRADIQGLHNSINSIYSNVDQQLKEQGFIVA